MQEPSGLWNSLGREDFPLQLLDVASKFWQTAEGVDGAQPLSVIESWGTTDDFAGIDVAVGAGLGGDDDSIAYSAVPGDANLPGEQDALADVGGAGEAYLGT